MRTYRSDPAERTTGAMVLDSVMPVFDARIAEHIIVNTDIAMTLGAARGLDFLTVRSPVLTVAMWLRGLPARLRGRQEDPPPRLAVAEGTGLPGWLVLGERPGQEIAFGAVGKFWQPVIEWRDTTIDEFVGFTEPGWGLIAAGFQVRPCGRQATLLSYECRTVTTDENSRRLFLRYWWLIRPFVAYIMRATLRTIRIDAEPAGAHSQEPIGTQRSKSLLNKDKRN
jgi:hypothetical protein